MRGEDDVEDVGDGGPKLETGISVCGEGAVEPPGVGDAAWLEVDGVNAGAVCVEEDVSNGEGKPCTEMR